MSSEVAGVALQEAREVTQMCSWGQNTCVFSPVIRGKERSRVTGGQTSEVLGNAARNAWPDGGLGLLGTVICTCQLSVKCVS
jgi:hypothetical protein